MGKKHVAWELFKDYHQGKDHGCIWIHASGWGETPCHYAMNGFAESKSRKDMYNKDHRAEAKGLGYVFDAQRGDDSPRGSLSMSSKIDREVGAKARGKQKQNAAKGKPFDLEAFREKYVARFGMSIKWLGLHPKGWHYGHKLSKEQLDKHMWQSRRSHGIQKTFQVYDSKNRKEGYGAWYPYHHNYHHMIPESALHKYVVGSDKDKAMRRVKTLCASGWNINKQLNIVLLPQEIAVSKIVSLPAHCPWGLKSHPSYSLSLRNELQTVQRELDKASARKDCEDVVSKVSVSLDSVAKKILDQIKSMKPGRQIGRLSFS